MVEYGPLLGGAGVFGVLAYVIIWLLRSNRDDRADFGKERAGLGKEIDDAEARADKAEARAERLQGLLDAANEERRKALDFGAEHARAAAARADEIAKQRDRIDELGAEINQLRNRVP